MFAQKDTIPAWEKLYNEFHTRNYGETIDYNEIQKVLGGKYNSWRSPVYKMTKMMETKDQKTLRNMRKGGYLVVNPNEHIELGKKRIIRSRRQLVKGRRTMDATNLSVLTPGERKALADMRSKVAFILTASNKRVAASETKPTVDERTVRKNMVDVDNRLRAIEALLKKKKKAEATS